MMEINNQCPRCAGRLRSWKELSDEDREVAKRLPASADYTLEQRVARHRWCAKCWFEDTGASPTLA